MVAGSELKERAVLERLKDRYQRDGYSFYLYPSKDFLPSFLQGYRPDAVALKDNGGVIIEIKSQAGPQKELRLSELARLFAGRQDWRLEIVSAGEPQEQTFEAYSRNRIERELLTVEELARGGHLRAALVIAWGVLEAATRALRTRMNQEKLMPIGPNEVSELLAREGIIDQNTAQTLRRLGQLRNAIVHGNFEPKITEAEVDPLVATTRQLLDELQPAA